MKTLEQIAAQWEFNSIDGRDLRRLIEFVPADKLHLFKMELVEGAENTYVAKEFSRENILKQLKADVEFGFEKALNQRGISASLMYGVVSMWNWVLEEGLENFTDYAQYGLPLFKTTAVKYGFDNPIGNDSGSEQKYASDY